MRFADLGLRLAITAGLFAYLGYRLDQWLDTAPAFLLAGSFLGFGLGMWTVVRAVNSWQRAKDDPPGGETPGAGTGERSDDS